MRHPDTSLIPFAVGVLLLGCVGIAAGDFALQWQPVPAHVPYRTTFAYLSAVLLIAGGVAMLTPMTSSVGAWATGAFFGTWALILQGAGVIKAPTAVISWNGFAEITAIAAGGIVGWTLLNPERIAITGIARRVFGACFAVFGVAHFVYADFTADMVPSWMPARLFWAYATGVGHIGASVSLMLNRWTALASTLLTVMLASFAVLLHLPRVIASPTEHIEWVMLAISMTLTGAAWIVRASTIREPNRAISVAAT